MKIAINPHIGVFQVTKKCAEYMAERGHEGANRILKYNKDSSWDKWFGNIHNRPTEEFRKSSLLIEAIEKTSAHWNCKIVEIPDDVDFYIDEDEDGTETIREVSRSWS